jgi:hypothetical protein
MADWQAIKTEYITTATSYRKLAQKYGIHYKVISDRGKAEGWGELRSQFRDKTLTNTLDVISQKQVDRAARFQSVADKLLNKIESIVDAMEPEDMDSKAIRALTAAVKDLKEIQNIKSELDEKEQEARIANLRKQANMDQPDDRPKLVIEGLPEEFKI